jgi:hypothetical protein
VTFTSASELPSPIVKPTWPLVTATLLATVVGCGGSPASDPSAPSDPVPEPESAAASPAAPPASSAAAPSPAASPAAPRVAALPASPRFLAERVLDERVTFLVDGEGGRLAALSDRSGEVTPHRFERGSWQALPLPASARSEVGRSGLGIYFGRDNRLRLMGWRGEGATRRMVYLRHKDGAWRDERSEIGALAGDGSVLFGVLGAADPEVVCKVGGICLLKSVQGWKEIPNTLPESAVVRAFARKGWALTSEGVLVAGDGGFRRVGPPAPWRTEATGFVVDGSSVTVVEPGPALVHTLDGPEGTWRSEPSPIAGPRDVAGPAADRWIAGDGGLAHLEGAGFASVGDPTWRLTRVIVTPQGVVAGGPAGVVVTRARP